MGLNITLNIQRMNVCFARACWNSWCFNPICWATDSFFFRLESTDTINKNNFHAFGINGFDGNFQIKIHTIFSFFDAFIETIKNKNKNKQNHYSRINSAKNKSQSRTQREQTLSFGATMHDFSKLSGLVVLQPKQRNITGKLFFDNKFSSKKAILILFADHGQKKITQNWKKNWQRTLIIYLARKTIPT